jgi:hypothetical protein
MRRWWRRFGCLLIAMLAACVCMPARANPTATDSPSTYYGSLALESFANSDDVFLGASGGLVFAPSLGLGISATFLIRPYHEWVREGVRPHVFLQVHETRYAFAMQLTETQALGECLSVFAGAGMAYTLADYEGTHRSPDEGWSPLLDAGLAATIIRDPQAPLSIRLGYRYAELRADSDNWVYCALAIRL